MGAHVEAAGIMLLDSGGQGFELEGNATSLRNLADALPSVDVIQIHAEHGPASIHIVRSEGLLLMRQDGSSVTFDGTPERLGELARTIRFVAAGPKLRSSEPVLISLGG